MVLNVSTCLQDGTVRLYKSSAQEREQYVALSYCWGGPQSLITTKSNISERQHRIELACLPRSIADAIRVTAKLGLKYLWVDSLCIIQDDEVTKAKEIDGMGEVYSDATLVLLASGLAHAADDGFLNPLSEISVVPVLGGQEGTIARVAIAPGFSVPPLDQRGWTFQERYLASRRLEFKGAAGIVFSCLESSSTFACNAWGKASCEPPTDSVVAEDVWREFGVTTWHNLLKDYSMRLLTVGKDRLPAIAGYAKRYAALQDDIYLAGLWKSRIVDDLMWNVQIGEDNKISLDDYRQPGWSWISVVDYEPNRLRCAVNFPSKSEANEEDVAILLEHSLQLDQPDAAFGHVLAGKLTLRAKIAPITERFLQAERLKAVDLNSAYRLATEEEARLNLLQLKCGTRYNFFNERVQNYEGGLVLLPAGDGTWKRIGTFGTWTDTFHGSLIDWESGGVKAVILI